MKQSCSKKLSLSLKNNGVRQQKISSFFTSSRPTQQVLTEDERKEGNVTVDKDELKNEFHERTSVESLCTQCLKKCISNSDICNQCNMKESFQSKGKVISLAEGESSLRKKYCKISNNKSKVDVLSSPEILLATPPIKIKSQKNSVTLNPAKRKCCFDIKIHSSKKLSSSRTKQHCDIKSKSSVHPFKTENNSSKENIVSPKKSLLSDESLSVFCKPSFCKDTSNSVPNSITKVINNGSRNKKSVFDKEQLQLSNETESITGKIKDSANTVFNCIKVINYNLETSNRPTDLEKSESLQILHETEKINNGQDQNSSINTNVTIAKGSIKNANNNSFLVKRGCIFNSTHGGTSLSGSSDSSVIPSTKPSNHASFEDNNSLAPSNNDNFEDNIENMFDDSTFLEAIFNEPLKLDKTRCTVTSVEHLEASGEVVLGLTSCDTEGVEDTVTCVLRGSWANISIFVGDVVIVSARPLEGQVGCWVVDNEGGLLVIHPDTLLSGTTVVGSLFCMRRSVLSDMYRGIDSDSAIMVLGSFLHQLLQEVLKRKVTTLQDIEKVLDEFSKTRYFIFNLYSSDMSLEKTMGTLREFVPKIHGFLQKYISSKRPKTWNEEDSWKGSIQDIADIEENIWSPSLGLKGKIDVTVKTSTGNDKEKVMPLELKTGKASFSAEHRGQVILYTMMMSELGKTVDSGLLLYLREGVMKEVPVGAVERRDLMLLRNQLVFQLKASHRVVVDSNHKISAPALPPPIHHHSACSKCPYLTLCSAALRASGSNEVSEKNPLRQLSETSTNHLSAGHILYVFHWTGLLRLEHVEALRNSPALHNIWTLPPAERAKKGTCIPKVRLIDRVVEAVAGSYQHVFQNDSDITVRFSEGDYVIVSSASRPAVAAGPITRLSQSRLTLILERDLSTHQVADNVWYLDKYESQSGLVFNMTNLGCLLDSTEQAERLRKVVIDLELPDFSPKLSSRVLKASVDLLRDLNDQQRKAIFRALAADHYILIKGMPGTGKTATIVALVQLAVRLGRSVLVTSHTHSAVDNVLLRLRGKVDFLRLGAAHKLHPELVDCGEAGRTFASPEELHTFYSSKSVVGVTCLGSSHPLMTKRKFDLCIVDEATQVLQPTVLRPLYSAYKFILIGDPEQLPPLVRSSKAKELGLGESLFTRLDRPAITSELSLQYRMNQTITDLANSLTYGGKLKCGSTQVASATLSLPLSALDGEPVWVADVLSHSLSQSVVAVDTGVCEAVGCVNTSEAHIVMRLLATLAKGLSDERVGVISPYRAQVDYLRQQVKGQKSTVEVNTVDQYQGRDKDVIIYSCTRSAKPTESDILGDKNRLTVAVTRARHKLIIVGNVNLLREYSVFNQLFNSIPSICIVSIS